MEKEIWKSIIGYEDDYMISNLGRVKSFKINKNGVICKSNNKKGWYLDVRLTNKKGKVKTHRIHRLVAEHFLPNKELKKYVNHKDMNKQNNNYLNLEWVTSRENVMHAILNKPSIISAMNHYNTDIRPKKIIQKTLNGDYIAEFKNAKDASDFTGVCSRNILQVASKDEYIKGHIRKQAGGYIWEYKI